jgi:acetyltransferase-like isoleucine patch superfamily enzyme
MWWDTFWACLSAYWWGINLGSDCSFAGHPCFHRHPESRISIGAACKFNSSPTSNLIGINRPCIVATLREGADIQIGYGCGFSGTVIGCETRIVLGENVRCGANTLITDTDWHVDDERAGYSAPVGIERGVWLGVNVMVLKGVTIGQNTFVGAGSVVTRSLPSNVIAAGSPARVIRPI